MHAAAIAKASKHEDPGLADAIYSGVPARLFGLEQVIEIGPMSGRSNVVYWLGKREIPATEEIVERIFAAAKQSDSVLTEQEILLLVASSARH